MIFSRNIILAAAAAVYGASSTSAFAPSTGECTHLCSSSIAVRKDYVELQLTSLFVAIKYGELRAKVISHIVVDRNNNAMAKGTWIYLA